METPNNFMVCTWCSTYNHHAYIEDAMNGFCIQKTDFPFVCIIADDASTDGNQEVIRKYFESNFNLLETEETDDFVLNYGRHKTNENCYFVVLYLKYNHYSIKKSRGPYVSRWYDNPKYYALCEGDDYWIDENKLQRQVDFLEEHEEYSMVFSNAKISQNELMIDECFPGIQEDRDVSIDELILNGGYFVPTPSMLYKKMDYYPDFCRNCLVGDYPLQIYSAVIGNVFCFKKSMVVYRKESNGSWTERYLRLPKEKQFSLFVSEMKMFNGINEITNYAHNYTFLKRKIVMMYYNNVIHREVRLIIAGKWYNIFIYICSIPFLFVRNLGRRLKLWR